MKGMLLTRCLILTNYWRS